MKRYIDGLKKRYPTGLKIQTEQGIATVISIDYLGRIIATCHDQTLIHLLEDHGKLIPIPRHQ